MWTSCQQLLCNCTVTGINPWTSSPQVQQQTQCANKPALDVRWSWKEVTGLQSHLSNNVPFCTDGEDASVSSTASSSFDDVDGSLLAISANSLSSILHQHIRHYSHLKRYCYKAHSQTTIPIHLNSQSAQQVCTNKNYVNNSNKTYYAGHMLHTSATENCTTS